MLCCTPKLFEENSCIICMMACNCSQFCNIECSWAIFYCRLVGGSFRWLSHVLHTLRSGHDVLFVRADVYSRVAAADNQHLRRTQRQVKSFRFETFFTPTFVLRLFHSNFRLLCIHWADFSCSVSWFLRIFPCVVIPFLLGGPPAVASVAAPLSKPNIIFILADDLVRIFPPINFNSHK